MPEKPSYLDMLNSIYMGEQRGYEYLSAWADVTPDPEVRAVLRTIALREGEHRRRSRSASTSSATKRTTTGRATSSIASSGS